MRVIKLQSSKWAIADSNKSRRTDIEETYVLAAYSTGLDPFIMPNDILGQRP